MHAIKEELEYLKVHVVNSHGCRALSLLFDAERYPTSFGGTRIGNFCSNQFAQDFNIEGKSDIWWRGLQPIQAIALCRMKSG
jgi:hypothetical protein